MNKLPTSSVVHVISVVQKSRLTALIHFRHLNVEFNVVDDAFDDVVCVIVGDINDDVDNDVGGLVEWFVVCVGINPVNETVVGWVILGGALMVLISPFDTIKHRSRVMEN